MRVKVKEPYSVDYKKKLYRHGESLDMDEKEAKRLIDKGVVVPDGQDESEAKENTDKSSNGKADK